MRILLPGNFPIGDHPTSIIPKPLDSPDLRAELQITVTTGMIRRLSPFGV